MALNPKNLGLAAGITWGVSLFVLTLISLYTGYASGLLNGIAGIYIGYSVSLVGSVIGLVYGFVDCFVCLYIFGVIYNYLEKK